MKVLVTGGAGFIGTRTAAALAAEGHAVRVLDCLDPQIHGADADFSPQLSAVAECLRGDVCNLEDCVAALDGVEAVIHLAARTGVGQSMYDLADYVETNVRGTATLVEAIIKSRASLQRVVLASSRAVYGEGMYLCATHGYQHPATRNREAMESGHFEMYCSHCQAPMVAAPTPEACDRKPLSVYAWTKAHQEDYCRWAQQTLGLPLVVLRYFNVYGAGQSLRNPYTGVVSIFYSLLKAGRSLSMYEGGRPLRDFVHVDDVVRANLLALSAEDVVGGTFNIGSGRADTISAIANALAAALGVEARLDDRGEFRVGDIFACFADLAESTKRLGYSPLIDITQGMQEFSAWAERQESVDLYDTTVAELDRHGLFGRARKSAT